MKRVSEIVHNVPVQQSSGDLSTLVRSLQYDSRRVTAVDAFVAVRGMQYDGHQYISDLFQRGCRVFFVDQSIDIEDAVVIRLTDTRRLMPFLARNFYNNVVDDLKLLAVTGTNGKTTTTYLVHAILQAAGLQPGLISTVETRLAQECIPSQRTTPEALDLHRMLYQMHHEGLRSAAIEVSSHALSLHRVDGVPFKSAVFTNLGRDHLDFYGSMGNYFSAKKMLFERLKNTEAAVINLDDPYGKSLAAELTADMFTFSAIDPAATVFLRHRQVLSDGMSLTIRTPEGELFCTTALSGKFNVYNILAAVTAGVSIGLDNQLIANGIAALQQVPGRLERMHSPRGFQVFVDYAHSPDALQRALEALLESKPARLTVVFGCGGDRDRGKRPMMGKVAEDYADSLVLTNDNPRNEDPVQILSEIDNGIFDKSKRRIIADRSDAIATVLHEAIKNEIILIAGKGHEAYQEVAGEKIAYDERLLVRSLLENSGD